MVLSFCLLVLIMQIMLINLSVANVDWPSSATVLGAVSGRCAAAPPASWVSQMFAPHEKRQPSSLL